MLSSEFGPLFVFPSSVPLSSLLLLPFLSLFLVLRRHCDYAARLIVKMKNPGAESKSEKTDPQREGEMGKACYLAGDFKSGISGSVGAARARTENPINISNIFGIFYLFA